MDWLGNIYLFQKQSTLTLVVYWLSYCLCGQYVHELNWSQTLNYFQMNKMCENEYIILLLQNGQREWRWARSEIQFRILIRTILIRVAKFRIWRDFLCVCVNFHSTKSISIELNDIFCKLKHWLQSFYTRQIQFNENVCNDVPMDISVDESINF